MTEPNRDYVTHDALNTKLEGVMSQVRDEMRGIEGRVENKIEDSSKRMIDEINTLRKKPVHWSMWLLGCIGSVVGIMGFLVTVLTTTAALAWFILNLSLDPIQNQLGYVTQVVNEWQVKPDRYTKYDGDRDRQESKERDESLARRLSILEGTTKR